MSDEEFSQASAMWASGAHQLVDIAQTFGVSVRSLQNHFGVAGVVKGETQAQALAALPLPTLDRALPDADELPATATAMRARSYSAAIKIEDAILQQLEVIRADPSAAFRANSTIKALSSAAVALEKLFDLKKVALGLDQQQADDLPTLTVRTLFDEEIARIQSDEGENVAEEDDDTSDEGHSPIDDVVTLDDIDT